MTKPKRVETVGTKLKELIGAHDYSQEDVAHQARVQGFKVSTKTVSNILRGRDGSPDYAPRGDTIRSVFAAFGNKGVEALRQAGREDLADILEVELHDKAVANFVRDNQELLRKLMEKS